MTDRELNGIGLRIPEKTKSNRLELKLGMVVLLPFKRVNFTHRSCIQMVWEGKGTAPTLRWDDKAVLDLTDDSERNAIMAGGIYLV